MTQFSPAQTMQQRHGTMLGIFHVPHPTSSLWRVIDGFKREDQLAFNKWRQDMEIHEDEQENEENEMGTTANRRKGEEKLMGLKNACLQYHSIQDKKMYLMMIRSIA